MSSIMRAITVISAAGAGVAAGTFFAFSTFTIEGLKRLPPSQGAAAMQAINKEAPTPPFMLLLFGTAVGLVVVAVNAARNLDDPASKYQFAAAVIYILAVVVLTGTYHVPRNDALDRLDPNSAEGVAYWATYLTEWVRMNHVRTIAPAVASILLTVSLQLD